MVFMAGHPLHLSFSLGLDSFCFYFQRQQQVPTKAERILSVSKTNEPIAFGHLGMDATLMDRKGLSYAGSMLYI